MNITWKPRAVGDILVGSIESPVIATWFGGDDDDEDSGETASGIITKGNPGCLGCALPVPTCPATHGSPLPRLPYLKTLVEVFTFVPGDGGQVIDKKITVPLIDVGPALDTNHAIDLTIAAFEALGGDLKQGTLKVWFRIVGGAAFLLPS